MALLFIDGFDHYDPQALDEFGQPWLARGKAEAAREGARARPDLEGCYIVAADTVVAQGRRILPKAEIVDEEGQA